MIRFMIDGLVGMCSEVGKRELLFPHESLLQTDPYIRTSHRAVMASSGWYMEVGICHFRGPCTRQRRPRENGERA